MSDPEFWPAPMEGIFMECFILSANELELADRWMTSFFRLSDTLPKEKVCREFLRPYASSGLPVCVQLMGRDPELTAAGALRMLEAGAASVDLNFGCPVPRVVKGGAGGALLRERELMYRITAKTVGSAGKEKVSVKFRCGFDSPGELEETAGALLDAGAGKLFFHHRTVKELYAPVPAPERAARFRRLLDLARGTPVILNGDFTFEEAASAPERSGCAGVMLGRNFLRSPGILRRLRGLPDCSPELFFHTLVRNGLGGEALKGMKRWIFGAWDFPVPPEGLHGQ